MKRERRGRVRGGIEYEINGVWVVFIFYFSLYMSKSIKNMSTCDFILFFQNVYACI